MLLCFPSWHHASDSCANCALCPLEMVLSTPVSSPGITFKSRLECEVAGLSQVGVICPPAEVEAGHQAIR